MTVITRKTFPLTALKENLGLKSLRSLTAEMILRANHLLNWIHFQTMLAWIIWKVFRVFP